MIRTPITFKTIKGDKVINNIHIVYLCKTHVDYHRDCLVMMKLNNLEPVVVDHLYVVEAEVMTHLVVFILKRFQNQKVSLHQ